ncbi:DUF3800 domain-containing protein [Patescibacteria group bacterium]|nr:DUF3800 domain-containing protein [Patescibacteria group bacterium]
MIAEKEQEINNKINQLKKELDLTIDYEFKFSRCKNKYKKTFLETIKSLSLEYKAIFVDKRKLRKTDFNSQQIYCEMLRRLFYDNNPPLYKTILILDEASAKIHHKEFNMILRKYLSKNVVNKIKQKRSKNETMIQIADMISGSIFKKIEKNEDKYYQIIKNKEKILIKF